MEIILSVILKKQRKPLFAPAVLIRHLARLIQIVLFGVVCCDLTDSSDHIVNILIGVKLADTKLHGSFQNFFCNRAKSLFVADVAAVVLRIPRSMCAAERTLVCLLYTSRCV